MKKINPALVALAALIPVGYFVLKTSDKGADIMRKTLPRFYPKKSIRLNDAAIADICYKAGWRGEDLIHAVAIALAESGGYPDAFLWNVHRSGRKSLDRGLFQINDFYHPELKTEDAWNPEKNAAYAFKLWKQAGWKPWITWQTNAHLKTRPRAEAAVKGLQSVSGPEEEIQSSVERELGGARPQATAAQIRALAKKAGWTGDHLTTAVAVALAESNGQINAISKNKDGSSNIGLWQLNAKANKLNPKVILDPLENAIQAWKIWDYWQRKTGNGWKVWGAYTDRRFLAYMPQAKAQEAQA